MARLAQGEGASAGSRAAATAARVLSTVSIRGAIRGGCGTIALLTILGMAGNTEQVDLGLVDFRQGRFAEAFQDWRRAAADNDANGALYIGVLYDSGLGVSQDYRQAMQWYRQAAEAGSAAGAFNVGVLYDAGLGVAKDPSQAATWYARAAAAGFGRAAYNLAMMYEAGTGVPRSRQRAAAFYQAAFDHGISAARDHLLALGQPVTATAPKPPGTAMQLFEQAQKILLQRGPREAAEAIVLFRQAAEQHNPLAEYDLGYCFEHGLGVAPDRLQAHDWYRRAVGDAHDDALRSIAETGARNLEPATVPSQGPPMGDKRSGN